LFVTCLVDFFRPSVGFAAIDLLERAGCTVEVPRAQACCGQPAFNSGDRADTKAIAEQVIRAFQGYDYVVVPSGSCGGMIAKHYPSLFKDDPDLAVQADDLAGRTHELVSFLADVMKVKRLDGEFARTVTYHDSCAGLRELGVKEQPRRLLQGLKGLKIAEMGEPEVCCGFGGTFCVKYPDISNKMVDAKAGDIEASGAEVMLAGDMGCLLNMAGKLRRRGSKIEVRHVAEVLAGRTAQPGIGDAPGDRTTGREKAAEAAMDRAAQSATAKARATKDTRSADRQPAAAGE
jgi:L-lactate dehydrogenase complex protein LldE